jgi:6-pyruvoyl-tetrahydropterin synthase
MYTVGVRDHIMVAHSIPGEMFGPAQRLHGATYTVSAELSREELGEGDVVIDIGLLRHALRHVLDELDYKNLDEHPAFQDHRSTTEHLARHIHRELGKGLTLRLSTTLTITLDESPVAWARYSAPVKGHTQHPPPLEEPSKHSA